MRNILAAVFLFGVLTGLCAQPQPIYGEVQVAFGWVRGPDGKKHSMKGLRFPFEAHRVTATTVRRESSANPGSAIKRPRPPISAPRDLASFVDAMVNPNLQASLSPSPPSPLASSFATTVYSAEAGTQGGYYVLGEIDPSSLDDHVMSGGANKLWHHLTLGVQIGAQRSFVMHWTVYNTYVSGRGHDVQAFDGVLADFAVIWPSTPPDVNPYYITINVSPQPQNNFPGVNCPDDTVYVSQQFRLVQPPDYPFDGDMRNVYHASAPPTVGSSENQFWYDWDPMNGIFAEDEVEILGPPEVAPFSNLLRAITVSGTQETYDPLVYNLALGVPISGDIFDLQDSDNQYLRFGPRWDVARLDPNARVVVESIASSTNANGFQFAVEAAGSAAGGSLTIELFNFTTNVYDLVGTFALTGTDTVRTVSVSSNIGRYINSSNRRIRSQVSFFAPTNVDRTYSMRIDHAFWMLTFP